MTALASTTSPLAYAGNLTTSARVPAAAMSSHAPKQRASFFAQDLDLAVSPEQRQPVAAAMLPIGFGFMAWRG